MSAKCLYMESQPRLTGAGISLRFLDRALWYRKFVTQHILHNSNYLTTPALLKFQD